VASTDQEVAVRESLLVPHYDAQWGHITIKMAAILRSHTDHPERARVRRLPGTKRHLSFTKEDNCFTQIARRRRPGQAQTRPCSDCLHLARCVALAI